MEFESCKNLVKMLRAISLPAFSVRIRNPPQQPLHLMSLRLPYEMAAYLIELAGTTDTSRVEMARQLVQAGIDAVLSRLPAEVAYDIHEAARERLSEMMSEL